MSFRELTMIDVLEVLRRWQSGQSARAIARDGVADRKTALRYNHAALASGIAETTTLDDGAVARSRVAFRSDATPPSSAQKLLAHRDRIEAWLRAPRPLRLVRIRELLARDGIDVGYTTLRRFAHDELGWRERADGAHRRSAARR